MNNDFGVMLAYALLFGQPAIAVVGIFVNAIGLREAQVDLSLTNTVNGKRRLVAQAHVEWEVIRLSVQCLLLVMGALSIWYPPDPDVVFSRAPVVIVNRLCLILCTILLAAKSIMGLRYQHQLLRLWIHDKEDAA